MVPQLTPSFLIRADGDDQMGAGHVMRSLALAEAIRVQGGSVVFLVALGCRTGSENCAGRFRVPAVGFKRR